MRQEFTISSTRKTEQLHCVIWKPDATPKGLIQIVHGMSEHMGRYEELALFFVKQGFVVVGHDQLGHGKTKKSQAEYGFFAHQNGHNIVIRDIHCVYKFVRKQYPNIPCILVGHSMGSYFARKYMTIYGKELSGVVLSGTGNQSLISSIAGYFIAQLFVLFKGDHYRSALIYDIVFDSYARSVKNRETEFDWLSRDKDNIKESMENASSGVNFTVSGNRDFMKVLVEIAARKHFDNIPKQLPLLFVSGKEDPVGNMGKGVIAVRNSFRKLGMTSVRVKLYEKDRHEILREVDRDVVFGDILKWIESEIIE